MPKPKPAFNLPAFIIVCAAAACLLGLGLHRLTIDADIVGSLPVDDPILSDARRVITTHPMQDQLVIDIGQQADRPEIIARAADFVAAELKKSGLFEQVGMAQFVDLGPELIRFAAENLPVLFTEKDLLNDVAPLLTPANLRLKLDENFALLMNLEGIGQAELLTFDPLGIRNLVLAKLSGLSPSGSARVFNGHLMSADYRHVLLTAKPHGSGTDTRFARRAFDVIDGISEALNKESASYGTEFSLTPVGAFRAALDNENMAKRDIHKVILFATVGIALLLILAFPRPYIGLLSLLPAIAGTITAIFIYSLLHETISILTIGFGGAIVSITVDHGIAYLLFLDRPYKTTGREAAREVWAIGLLATLTSIGAFLTLSVSGFSILSQIGQFAALGIACSFLFVHTVFPHIFSTLSAASRKGPPPLAPVVMKLTRPGRAYTATAALAFALVMLMFARPEFNADFRAMNTVTPETMAAEKRVAAVWGDISSKIFLMSAESNLEALRSKSDRLAMIVEKELATGALTSGFVPAMLFPGSARGGKNVAAWQAFWSEERNAMLRNALDEASIKWGFTADAFAPFLSSVETGTYRRIDIPEKFYPLLGIVKQKDGNDAAWFQYITLSPGPAYDDRAFYATLTDSQAAKVFDPRLFSRTLGKHLADTFLWMVLIIGASVTVLLFVFFLDWQLTLAALLPVIFAFISTLGTLRLLGHPLDIPGLMLSIIILGMGIDYALYFVRSHQRYRDASHSSAGLIRMAVFLAAASTLIGFGSLIFADHRLLKSAGLTCFLGIGYSLIGTFAILPPLLERLFKTAGQPADRGVVGDNRRGLVGRILNRYRHMETIPRILTHLRLKRDPMFREPAPFPGNPQTVLDIGTGYGLSAAWLLELFPTARIYGVESSPERARVSGLVVGRQGRVNCVAAPAIPALPETDVPAQLAVMVDMIHHLSNEDAVLTLKRLHTMLYRDGRLAVRTMMSADNRPYKTSAIDRIRQRLTGRHIYYRSEAALRELMARAGFDHTDVRPCGSGRAGHWFIACKDTPEEKV